MAGVPKLVIYPGELDQSHGCIHVRPVDRDELQKRGDLHPGVDVEVMKYGEIGPAR
jgi:hypothetical protein